MFIYTARRMCNIAIIGGGPAGIMSAIVASENLENKITIFEKDLLLKTILPTGAGRCNLSYKEDDFKVFAKNYPRGERFLYSVFSRFDAPSTLDFFEQIGLKTYVQDDFRVFPVSNSSKSVRSILLNQIQKPNIEIVKKRVVSFEKTDKFIIKTEDESYQFDKIIIATGSRDCIYSSIENAGHKIIPQKPCLCAFDVEQNFLYKIPGVVLKNTTFLGVNGDKSKQQSVLKDLKGDILITHKSLSGPLIYKISSLCAGIDFDKNNPLRFFLNLIDSENFEKEFEKKLIEHSKKDILNILSVYVPKSFAQLFCEQINLKGDTKANQLKSEFKKLIIKNLTNFEVTVKSTIQDSEVVNSGGVCLDEINPKTMESKIVPGLHFCGEVIDVDGFCGGFNLQNCWSTGFVAAHNVGF